MSDKPTIIYTRTDEAPLLATRSLLPVIRAYAAAAGVDVQTRDISLAGRILDAFADLLPAGQGRPDTLAELGELVRRPEANVVKLPNISASLPQLVAAIAELQGADYPLPDYPDEVESDEQAATRARYDKVKGSAVNPVLRQGNSDRRAPLAVKQYARRNPHSMGAWSAGSRTSVATMSAGDFFHNEKSVTVPEPTTVRIEQVEPSGAVTLLKELPLLAGEVFDGTVMSRKALVDFLGEQIDAARDRGLLFSLHLKATMMKVSDPIIFGHAVKVFFADLFAAHGPALEAAGADPDNGFGDVLAAIGTLPEEQRAAIEAEIAAIYERGPELAMVNSDKGITNLHVPSDVIIDASMPAMIRNSGQMWDKEGRPRDTLAVIPDSSYAGVYATVIDFCKEHGALDPTTMGSVSNVGLMAQKAEEYGSHDKTFEITADGLVRVIDAEGVTLMEHEVAAGDIWRGCQAKDAPIRDWIKLAVRRARATGSPAVFWLDEERAHDARVLAKIRRYLPEHDTEGLDIRVLEPAQATRFSLERIARGLDTISVTGNVLRDFLTDLFPILEVGTSAKLLSIVPLMAGGGLFETGAGGSAPKHVQQFVAEGHLRWDSLGEYLALAASLEHVADKTGDPAARVLGAALDKATTEYLLTNRSPSRKGGEIDNRGSTFYLAMYWARALAEQDEHGALRARFQPVAAALADAEESITAELLAAQGAPVDMGGYYLPDAELADAAMRPSPTLNAIIAAV